MKNTLLYLFIGLLFVGCSNDPDDTVQEEQEDIVNLKMKRYLITYYEVNSGQPEEALEYLFNEDGTISKSSNIFFETDETLIFPYNYSYNDSLQLKQKERYRPSGSLISTDYFVYNDEKQLENMIVESYNNGDVNTFVIDFTYQNNTIRIQREGIVTDFYTLDSSGNIVNVQIAGDFNNTERTIEYLDSIIPRITETQSIGFNADYSLAYDDRVNPMHELYSKNPYAYGRVGVGNFFQNKYYFSAHNLTRFQIDSSYPESDYTDIISYKYNEQELPVSARVERNGVLIEEMIYEYY